MKRIILSLLTPLAITAGLTSSASAQMDHVRYARSINGSSDWSNELLALGDPGDLDCTGPPVDWATCIDGSVAPLNVTSFEAFVVPPGQVVTQVWVDVLTRYDQGQTGRWRIQLEHGSTGVIYTDQTDCLVSGPQGNCRWRFNSPASPYGVDVTSQVLSAEANHNQLDQIDMRVRRFNPSCVGATGLKVKAFRMVFRTELDCDNSGFADSTEITAWTDADGNGGLDSCQPGYGDCNNNGRWDLFDAGYMDCNNNGTMDSCELNPVTDCDGDGILDSCQIAANPGLDMNNNGILDLACECLVSSFCPAAPNSVRIEGAYIELNGFPSIGSGFPISLRATSLPADSFGIFLMGNGMQFPVSLGDGFLCLGQGAGQLLIRLQPSVQADTTGMAERQLAFPGTYLGNLNAGETRYFQLWYRDHAAGGTGVNLSNGVAVTFCP